MAWIRLAVLAAVSSTVCGAQMPSFTGFWKLNAARSTWGGGKQVPTAVMVEIHHNDPNIKYTGTVIDQFGDERTFEFAGATDGREHATVRPCGPGKVTLVRMGPHVIVATFKSDDGAVTEQTRMTLSRDSQRLTYDMRVTDRGREVHWTEVYDKR